MRTTKAVDDYSGSARMLAATNLRNVLGTMNLLQHPVSEGVNSRGDAGKYWKTLASLRALWHGCIRSMVLQMLATRYWEKVLNTKYCCGPLGRGHVALWWRGWR